MLSNIVLSQDYGHKHGKIIRNGREICKIGLKEAALTISQSCSRNNVKFQRENLEKTEFFICLSLHIIHSVRAHFSLKSLCFTWKILWEKFMPAATNFCSQYSQPAFVMGYESRFLLVTSLKNIIYISSFKMKAVWERYLYCLNIYIYKIQYYALSHCLFWNKIPCQYS